MKTSKKILFIYKNQTLSKVFEENLYKEGYDLEILFKEQFKQFRLTFLQKIINIICRVFFKVNNYPIKAEQYNFKKYCEKSLKNLASKSYDYCLVIRGDLIPEFVIKHTRSISNKMVDFQLDGLSVSSKILDYHKYFDDIFVFDENDISQYPNYPLKHTTNCFFEDASNKNKEIDFLYIGVNTEKRKQDLSSIHRFLESLNHQYNYQFLLTQNQYRKESPIDGITFFEKPLSYEDCLSLSRNAQCVIDLKRKEHDGLSLRFFEALVYKNKIITDNFSVKKYDFYHPNNIYITDFNSFDGLENFLKLPYHNLNHEITDKYNFKYWIKNIFDLH